MMKPQLFIHYSDPAPNRIKPVVNGYTAKPRLGGIWTSTYIGEVGSGWTETSHLINYASRDPREMNWYILYPNQDARVFEVDCLEDAENLFQLYGTPNIDFPDDLHLMTLDFERLQDHYDALHLTRRGEFETRNKERYPNLSGWDCESTIWFRWCFYDWEKIHDSYDQIEREKEQNKKKKVRENG